MGKAIEKNHAHHVARDAARVLCRNDLESWTEPGGAH
jgi:hypothetical protein